MTFGDAWPRRRLRNVSGIPDGEGAAEPAGESGGAEPERPFVRDRELTPEIHRQARILGRYRTELQSFGRRSRATVLLSAVVGATTGGLVALYAGVGKGVVFERIFRGPLWLQVLSPVAALVLSLLSLRYLAGGASPSTSEEYIRNVHELDEAIPLRPAPGRLVASWFTLSLGGGCGFEAPSIYLGATIGTYLQRRLRRLFTIDEAKVLMAAGAAAGVAAVFKAPATGAIFAVEVPYRDDMARRLLLPALVGAASGYVVDVLLTGTTPLFPISSTPAFDLRDIGGAAVVGLLGGFGARLFASAIRRCKELTHRTSPRVHVTVGCAGLASLALTTRLVYGQAFSLGDGEHALEWGLDPKRSLFLVVLLLLLRGASTIFTLGGAGAGGLVVPLVVEGALLGRAVGAVVGANDTALFSVLGVAAFLGAGYRVPLAAIMFVAETTGKPGFIVPGLIAAVVAELCMGNSVISPSQTARPRGHIEGRMNLHVSTVVDIEEETLPPTATVAELISRHIVGKRQRQVCVVDEHGHLVGVVGTASLSRIDQSRWATTPVVEAIVDVPVAAAGWTLGRALSVMEEVSRDVLPVAGDDGGFVGVVRMADILELGKILDQNPWTGDPDPY